MGNQGLRYSLHSGKRSILFILHYLLFAELTENRVDVILVNSLVDVYNELEM